MSALAQMPSRRAVLGGGAVAFGLPFLESLAGRSKVRAAACPQTAPRRLLVYHVPNGVYINRWLPRGTGTDYQMSETLSKLAPTPEALAVMRNDIMVVTGLVNGVGVPFPGGG